MTTPIPERRRHERHPIEAPVTLQVIFPEDTFSPISMRGTTKEMSATGMRVVTQETSESTYRRIIRQLRYVKAFVRFPGEKAPLVLHGAINWVQYDNKETPPVCTYGIAFSENKPQELIALQRCLERLGRQGTEPAAARRPDALDLD